jgi:hypothetical protein
MVCKKTKRKTGSVGSKILKKDPAQTILNYNIISPPFLI